MKRAKKVTITMMPKEEYKYKTYAKSTGRTLSGLIRISLEKFIKEKSK